MNPDAVNLTYEPAINEVVVPILPRDVCNDWIDTANVTEGMICAGYPEGGKDACQVSSQKKKRGLISAALVSPCGCRVLYCVICRATLVDHCSAVTRMTGTGGLSAASCPGV